MKVVVLHSVNGTTKVAEFVGELVTSQAMPGVIQVDVDGGYAKFTAGMVCLSGAAIDQYGPLSKPEEIK